MKLRVLLLLSAFLLFLVAFQLGQRRVQAQNQNPPTIPASFGHCVGYINHNNVDGLIFEATDGTIRVVNVANGAVILFARQ